MSEDKDNHKAYLEFKGRLDDIKEKNERTLGKQILLISGGAFTISLTILKDIYPTPLQWSRWLLILSWIFFGLAAFIQLFSMHFSSLAVEIQQKNLEDYYKKNEESAREKPNKYNIWVRRFNAFIHWIIVLGFICVIIFASANFIQEKEEPMKKKEPVKIEKNTQKAGEKKGVTMPKIPVKQENTKPKEPPKKDSQ